MLEKDLVLAKERLARAQGYYNQTRELKWAEIAQLWRDEIRLIETYKDRKR